MQKQRLIHNVQKNAQLPTLKNPHARRCMHVTAGGPRTDRTAIDYILHNAHFLIECSIKFTLHTSYALYMQQGRPLEATFYVQQSLSSRIAQRLMVFN